MYVCEGRSPRQQQMEHPPPHAHHRPAMASWVSPPSSSDRRPPVSGLWTLSSGGCIWADVAFIDQCHSVCVWCSSVQAMNGQQLAWHCGGKVERIFTLALPALARGISFELMRGHCRAGDRPGEELEVQVPRSQMNATHAA
jgi:hypothetical protein